MLGTETHADESRGDALQERPAVEELENPRRFDAGAAEDALDDIILDGDLHPLCRARGEFAALLPAGEFVVACRGHADRFGENISGGDGILNCQVDAHAPHRRQPMGRCTAATPAWPTPALEASP